MNLYVAHIDPTTGAIKQVTRVGSEQDMHIQEPLPGCIVVPISDGLGSDVLESQGEYIYDFNSKRMVKT